MAFFILILLVVTAPLMIYLTWRTAKYFCHGVKESTTIARDSLKKAEVLQDMFYVKNRRAEDQTEA